MQEIRADIKELKAAILSLQTSYTQIMSKISEVDGELDRNRKAVEQINASIRKGFWMVVGTILASAGSLFVAIVLLLVKYASANFGRITP